MKPTIGRIVTYIVGDHEAKDTLGWWPAGPNGTREHPAIITRVWTETCVNLQVLFDANPIEVRTSVGLMPELPEGCAMPPENSWWKWPDRVPSEPQAASAAVHIAGSHENDLAFLKGRSAGLDSLDLAANPYDESSHLRRLWESGWASGKRSRDAA